MILESIADGVYVSPVQINVSPSKLDVENFSIIPHNPLIVDIFSKIVNESASRDLYVAVSENWLIDEYLRQPTHKNYDRLSIECALSTMSDKKIIGKCDHHIADREFIPIVYLKPEVVDRL